MLKASQTGFSGIAKKLGVEETKRRYPDRWRPQGAFFPPSRVSFIGLSGSSCWCILQIQVLLKDGLPLMAKDFAERLEIPYEAPTVAK